MSNVSYEIKSTIAVLSKSTKGWQKELNLISWNGAEPKFDLRDWAPEHEKMGKGITLTQSEAEALFVALAPCIPQSVINSLADKEEAPEVSIEEVVKEAGWDIPEEVEIKEPEVVDLDTPESDYEDDPLLKGLPPEVREAVIKARGESK